MAQFKGEACKVNIRCDKASALCLFDTLDSDGDGYPAPACGGTDCDDSNPNIHPGAPEVCNGKDDNCNGQVDDGATCTNGGTCQSGACVCSGSLQSCNGACVDIQTDVQNCGGCSQPCGGSGVCVNGNCASDSTCSNQSPNNCGNCCQQHHPHGLATFLAGFAACACTPQLCATQCASAYCANPPASPANGDACSTCAVSSDVTNNCRSSVSTACAADPDCVLLETCAQSCPTN